MKKKENTLRLYSKTHHHSIKVSRVDFDKKWEEVNKLENLADIPEYYREGNQFVIDYFTFA
jgi:hypothetical protein